MTDSAEGERKGRRWLRAVLAAALILLLALFLPPFIGVSRYKSQITNLLSRSLGRPVRLSSVEVRVLPWPGFVLTDLSVAEDPAYGAEPVLHANKVTASIRLLALLRGRVEIGSISVDEASLNVVRAAPGVWNLDPLFRTAAAQTGPPSGVGAPARLPTLEATNSRIDFKIGAEKLPFSLVGADMTVWQQNPDEWRIRLRGQPARTDVSLDQEETGVLRMEASVRRGPTRRQMPVQLDVEWREAQLGQLARLVTGSDSGWRGDLTGEAHLAGTADATQIAVRLRAAGVHRAEFIPASPMDFDANCNFLFHYTQRSFQNLVCDSPLGDGRIHVTGEMPGGGVPPSFTAELNRVPVGAGLDALRTLRAGLQPDLVAAGTVRGELSYKEGEAGRIASGDSANRSAARAAKPAPIQPGPLSGSLTVENLVLTGGGLTKPIQAPKIVLAPEAVATAGSRVTALSARAPAATAPAAQGALTGTVAIPAGGTIPLTLGLRFSLVGYQVTADGQASIPRAREIAHAAGVSETAALGALAGDPVAIDVVAQGPWIPKEELPLNEASPQESAAAPLPQLGALPAPAAATPWDSDSIIGTVTVRNANWQADYLAAHLEIAEATLHLNSGTLRWDPVAFSYGPLKGTATLTLPPSSGPQIEQAGPALPVATFSIAFADVDAASLQAALLGARQPGTVLSKLIDRLRPSSAPPWPRAQGTIAADSLLLGPVKIEKIAATLDLRPDEANVTSLQANLLGGRAQLTGTLHRPATGQDKPDYAFSGDFDGIDPKALGQLLGVRWTGSPIVGSGKVELAGYAAADLAVSAKGTLHIETRYGSIAPIAKARAEDEAESETGAGQVPETLGRFSRLTADATIAVGAVALDQIQVVSTGRKRSVAATVSLANPPVVSFEAPKPSVAKR